MTKSDLSAKFSERFSDPKTRRRSAVRMVLVTLLCAGALVATAVGLAFDWIGPAPYWLWSGLIGGCTAGALVFPWLTRRYGLPKPLRTVGDFCGGIYFVALIVVLWCDYVL